jgi:hypothetical protein
MDLARETKFGGVFALNAHLFHQLGDPIYPSLDAARARLQPMLDEVRREAVTGRWDREDEAGLRCPAGVWIDDLVGNEMPVSMIFSEDDLGFDYVTDRLRRRMEAAQRSGHVRIHMIPGLDHSLHRAWLRGEILEIFLEELDNRFPTARAS